jgi:hypothetical protein
VIDFYGGRGTTALKSSTALAVEVNNFPTNLHRVSRIELL